MRKDSWLNKKTIIPLIVILLTVLLMPFAIPHYRNMVMPAPDDGEELLPDSDDEIASKENRSNRDELVVNQEDMLALIEELQDGKVISGKEPGEKAITRSEPIQEQETESDIEIYNQKLSKESAELLIKDINRNYLMMEEETNRIFDSRIVNVQADTQEEIALAEKEHQRKMREKADEMQKRGLYDSGIRFHEQSKLERERDQIIEKIYLNEEREIEELENLRRYQLAELEQQKNAAIRDVIMQCE